MMIDHVHDPKTLNDTGFYIINHQSSFIIHQSSFINHHSSIIVG